MTYDPIDTNDDGVVDADVDNQSVNTEELSNTYFASSFDSIQATIDASEAVQDHPTVVVDGDGPDANGQWVHDGLLMGSNTTLIIQNAYVKLADGADTNIIRNRDKTNGNDNLSVIGIGNAIIDGNAQNQNRTQKDPKFIGINFTHKGGTSNGIRLKGFELRNTTAWAVKSEGYDNVTVDIEVEQDGSQQNQDGVHINGPAEDIEIDVNGQSQDDMAIIDATSTSDNFLEGAGGDVIHWTIKAANSGNYRVVKILGGDGNLIYDGTVEVANAEFGTANEAVKIGPSYYPENPPNSTDITDITIQTVQAFDCSAAVLIDSGCSSIRINNIQSDRATALKVTESCRDISVGHITHRGSGELISIDSGATVDGLEIGGATAGHLRFVSERADTVLAVGGTLNDLQWTGARIEAATTIFDVSGTASGLVGNWDVEIANVDTVYAGVGGLRFTGDMPAFDAAPAHVVGSEVLASPSWDPDGDGNGERVMSDGTTWQEVVDLPNYT